MAGNSTCGCQMSRRGLLGTAGAAAAVTVVSACGGEEPKPQEVRYGQVVGQTTDVPEGAGAVFNESKLVVTQPERDDYRAFGAACTHGGCTVQEVDEVIRCLCHGSEFDISTGEPLRGPAQEPLEAFNITVEGTDIILDSAVES